MTCLIETLEQVLNMFKVNNSDTRTTSLVLLLKGSQHPKDASIFELLLLMNFNDIDYKILVIKTI